MPGLVLEVRVTIEALDVGSVFEPSGLAVKILWQAGSIIEVQLLCNVRGHPRRHIGWVRKKRAQEPHGAKLQGKAQAIVVPPATCDMAAVGVVQVEMTSKLLVGWLSVEPTIPLGLFVREEIDGHGETLRVLKH